MGAALRNWQPMHDSVLIERLEPMLKPQGAIITTANEGNGPILRKGRVLAVGPGKWIPGEWWPVDLWRKMEPLAIENTYCNEHGIWEWIPAYRETPQVKPGDLVLFNARWNDLRDDCLRGTGSDGSGPLERPLNFRFDEKIHLVQENDILGILH